MIRCRMMGVAMIIIEYFCGDYEKKFCIFLLVIPRPPPNSREKIGQRHYWNSIKVSLALGLSEKLGGKFDSSLDIFLPSKILFSKFARNNGCRRTIKNI